MGAGLVAVPILIHLLGRHRARVQRFPTLRFLEQSQLVAARRKRLTDPLLLLVRAAIVILAAAALARPRILTGARPTELGRTLTRAIVVDTSASMLPVRDSAERVATRLAGEAASSVIVRSAAPSSVLGGATAWLSTREGRAELIVISDFQLGTLDSIAAPADIGVKLIAIRGPDRGERPVPLGAAFVRAANRIDATWSARTADSVQEPILLASPQERASAQAATVAAASIVPAPTVPLPIAIVFPGYDARASVRAASHPIDASWMAEAYARLKADALLAEAAASAETKEADSTGAPVARNDAGAIVVDAAAGEIDGKTRLILFANVDAGSVASAALIAAVRRAAPSTPIEELETELIPATTLARWSREPGPARQVTQRTPGTEGPSDGRWLWMAVLGLIALETWMRRAT